MVPDQAGVFCVKNQIVVFKVMITVQVQNFIESLCILYLLYHDLLATIKDVLIYYSC